ncbi:TetR/AcrR family transcriptional regulator [Trinickia terrae]|uniref:TetR/AcrR family transcriptional regulator n=1 Tax=Trinickia terrae TaxID=2571161 RepID=A0A4V6WQ98_9BURK|nr:TetR/AcrR family transcriptional regulator [Trinickia terrae]TKC87790.1 TetR/AcrR family transcriptional regulator [Trinickia terrae]
MSTLTRKSETTFAFIVSAALEMAAAEGIGKLSLGEVAKRLGISKSGVFARVGSLEALQEAVLDESDRRFFAEVFQPALALPAGLPRLDAMVAGWIKRAADADSAVACIYTAGAFEFDDLDSPLRERLQEGVVRSRAVMRRTVLQAMELGHLRPDTDPEQLVFEISSLIVGLMHEVRFMRDPSAEQRMRGAYGRLIATYKSLSYQGN